MPIKVGKDFILEDNILSIVYSDIFKGLNIARAWVNNSDESKIVYTTKNPIVGDNLYTDFILSTTTKIRQIISETTIVDTNGVIYIADSTKNSYFEYIPKETKHEYVTVNDFLELTNV